MQSYVIVVRGERVEVVTTSQACALFAPDPLYPGHDPGASDVTPRLVRGWVAAGKLAPLLDDAGEAVRVQVGRTYESVFLRRDVEAAERLTRTSGKSHRRAA